MAGSFVLFAVLASFRFPGGYGPWDGNTISQLGNIRLDPLGANLYRAGCILSGVLAIGFFISLNSGRAAGAPTERRIWLLVRISGIAGGVGLLMNGIFPETQYAMHHFWAGVIFNSFAACAVLTPFALWSRVASRTLLAAFCVIALLAVMAMFAFPSRHWLEWPAATMLLAYPSFIAVLLTWRACDASVLRTSTNVVS
jgi:hypothetical membrane protein